MRPVRTRIQAGEFNHTVSLTWRLDHRVSARLGFRSPNHLPLCCGVDDRDGIQRQGRRARCSRPTASFRFQRRGRRTPVTSVRRMVVAPASMGWIIDRRSDLLFLIGGEVVSYAFLGTYLALGLSTTLLRWSGGEPRRAARVRYAFLAGLLARRAAALRIPQALQAQEP